MRDHAQGAARMRREDGAVLVIALLFVGVVGLLITAVLGFTMTGVSSVPVQRDATALRYAADAGMKFALQELRSNPEACDPDHPEMLQPPSTLLTNSGVPYTTNTAVPDVDVACEVTNLEELEGARGYALITRDPTNLGLVVSGGASGDDANTPEPEGLLIGGPVFLSHMPDELPFTVRGGNAYRFSPTDDYDCPDMPAEFSVEGPFFGYSCARGPVPDPAPQLPTMIPPDDRELPDPDEACGVFEPGTYYGSSFPDLTEYDDVYFASGVYYFEDVSIDVTRQSLVGGKARIFEDDPDSDPSETTAEPCASDDDSVYADGTGVTFILGGSSRLVVDNPSARVELFPRVAAAASDSTTDGISIMTVTGEARETAIEDHGVSAGAWRVSTADATEPVLHIGQAGGDLQCDSQSGPGGGQTLSFAVHGLTYIPNGCIAIRNTQAETKLLGGVVVNRLLIGTSAQIGGFNISRQQRPVPRKVKITSTASLGVGNKASRITATAVVDDRPTNRTTVVTSWFGD